MREIKIKYYFKDRENKIHTLTESIEEIESYNDIPVNIKNGWELIARCEYVGTTSKNKKEIYEGDIVRWVIPEDVGESEREKRIIFWSKDSCGFYGKTLDSKYHCFIDGELFEVIGNIYENPELLK